MAMCAHESTPDPNVVAIVDIYLTTPYTQRFELLDCEIRLVADWDDSWLFPRATVIERRAGITPTAEMPVIVRCHSKSGYTAHWFAIGLTGYASIPNTRRYLVINNWLVWMKRSLDFGDFDTVKKAWSALQLPSCTEFAWMDSEDDSEDEYYPRRCHCKPSFEPHAPCSR